MMHVEQFDKKHRHRFVNPQQGIDNDNNDNDDPNFDRKLDLITEGAQPYLREYLLTKITRGTVKL